MVDEDLAEDRKEMTEAVESIVDEAVVDENAPLLRSDNDSRHQNHSTDAPILNRIPSRESPGYEEPNTTTKVPREEQRGATFHSMEGSELLFFQRLWWNLNHYNINNDALVLGCRMATSFTLASLFTFLRSPSDPFLPHASWIMTTAGTVAYNSSLDTATAMKKALERAVGTAIGATMGLAAGYLSLAVFSGGSSGQAFVLAVGLAVESFLVSYLTTVAGFKGSYAGRLTLLTYGIMVLGFYTENVADAFRLGLFRTFNISMGCVVSGLSALLVFPLSTKSLLEQKIARQLRSAGQSAQLVLSTSHSTLVGATPPQRFEALLTQEGLHDAPYEAYNKSMEDWKTCRDLFKRLKWDPTYQWLQSRAARTQFEQHMSSRLARVFRIQTIVVSIDMIVRFGAIFGNELAQQQHVALHDVLVGVGSRLAQLLDPGDPSVEGESRSLQAAEAAEHLMEHDLIVVRNLLQWVRRDGACRHHEGQEPTTTGRSHMLPPIRLPSLGAEQMPPMSLERHELAALFCSLLEQLILRSVRLYHYCGLYDNDANNTSGATRSTAM